MFESLKLRSQILVLLGAFAMNCAGNTMTGIHWAKSSRAVDALFTQEVSDIGPGCAVGVVYQGRYIHKAGYGLANLEYNIPITPESVFRIASVSKQFTAMAIALLAERGDLDLDEDIHHYLPDLIDYGHKVSIRNMVLHLSGMADYGDDAASFSKEDGSVFRFGNQDYLTTEEFYQKLKLVPLAVKPGKEFRYSNFAYFLLSQVVGKVSGLSLREFVEKEIFKPLGMNASFFNDNPNTVVPKRADGYRKDNVGNYQLYMTNLPWVGDGGVYTSIDDFIKWDQNFYRNILGEGRRELVELMTTPDQATYSGKWDSYYAFGIMRKQYRGQMMLHHSGGWVAFTSWYSRLPQLRLSVVTFCNEAGKSAPDFGRKVLDLYLDQLIEREK